MNSIIRPIEKTFRTEPELDWNCGKNTFKKSGGSSGEGVRMFGRREIFTIQLVKKTLQAEPVPVWSCGKNIVRILTFGFADCCVNAFVFAMGFSVAGSKNVQKMWEGRYWEGVWLFPDPWDVVGLRTTSSVWNVPGKDGPHGDLFFGHSLLLPPSGQSRQHARFFFGSILAIATGFRVATVVRTKTKTQV